MCAAGTGRVPRPDDWGRVTMPLPGDNLPGSLSPNPSRRKKLSFWVMLMSHVGFETKRDYTVVVSAALTGGP